MAAGGVLVVALGVWVVALGVLLCAPVPLGVAVVPLWANAQQPHRDNVPAKILSLRFMLILPTFFDIEMAAYCPMERGRSRDAPVPRRIESSCCWDTRTSALSR